MDLYLAVSRIDEFKRVATTDWCSEERLISQITTKEPLGWQALYGEALHACIEKGGTEWTSREGVTVHWPADIVKACRDAWPTPCVWERRCYRDYDVSGARVTVAGRADANYGLGVIEGKTKFGSLDLEDFTSSLQWRFYLDMLPWARYVEYRIHEIGGMYTDKATGELRLGGAAWACGCETPNGRPRERRKQPMAPTCEDCGAPFEFLPGGARLEDIHAFRMWRQDGIRDELMVWMERFVAWARKKNLTEYLKPWGERAA